MRVAEAMGVSNPEEAATIGLAEWVARRKSELDDRDLVGAADAKPGEAAGGTGGGSAEGDANHGRNGAQ